MMLDTSDNSESKRTVQAKTCSTTTGYFMGLERRGNGLYLYRKKRLGNRVISEYCGSGHLAILMQKYDQLERDEAQAEDELANQTFERMRQCFAEVDQVIDSICQEAQLLEDALYLIAGYHKHSRQWRKKRNEND